jgi:hypothetical protein
MVYTLTTLLTAELMIPSAVVSRLESTLPDAIASPHPTITVVTTHMASTFNHQTPAQSSITSAVTTFSMGFGSLIQILAL